MREPKSRSIDYTRWAVTFIIFQILPENQISPQLRYIDRIEGFEGNGMGTVMKICISVQEMCEWVNGHIQEILIFE
jgi:hypothetical protein